MSRSCLALFGGLLLNGCASAHWTPPVGTDALVSLTLETEPSTARQMLHATFTNRSNRSLCFRSDMFTNRESTEVQYKIRGRAGRTRYSNSFAGYVPEPHPGLTRLDPGASIRARYVLYARSKPRAGGSSESLQARFRYFYYPCDAERKPGGAIGKDLLAGRSGWQRI